MDWDTKCQKKRDNLPSTFDTNLMKNKDTGITTGGEILNNSPLPSLCSVPPKVRLSCLQYTRRLFHLMNRSA